VLDDKALPLPLAQRLQLAIGTADGMCYLHNKSPAIIHRDLKSHNIFVHDVGGKLCAKIGDWGSARAALAGSKTMTHGVGTACWLSPEVIKHSRASKKSDAYAFAIVLWELATRSELYPGLTSNQIIASVANEGLRPEIFGMDATCPWLGLMTQCWSEEPEERLHFDQILEQLEHLARREGERLQEVKNARAAAGGAAATETTIMTA